MTRDSRNTMRSNVKSAQFDFFKKLIQKLNLPPDFSFGELLTGLGPRHARRDLLRVATILASVPVGLTGIRYLMRYGNKAIYDDSPSAPRGTYVITPEDYYEALRRELKENEQINAEQEKKSSSVAGHAKTASSPFARVMNVLAQYPLLAVGSLAIPFGSTYLANEYIFKPMEKGYLRATIDKDKQEYLQELRRTALLSKKILNDELSTEELLRLPYETRQQVADKVSRRLGIDYYSVLNVDPPSKKLGSHLKEGQFGLAWSLMRGLYALPALAFAVGVASAVSEHPLGTATKETAEAIRRWRAQSYPYLTESQITLPPPEFFEEEINYGPALDVKRPAEKELDTDAEEKIINKYVRERLKAIKADNDSATEDGVKEKRVRNTKILS